jgi:hypothetical protein
MSVFERLTAVAFHQGPAYRANELIDEVRSNLAAELGEAYNYEVPLSGRSWDYLRQVVAPRLALYLRSKRLAVGRCAPLFLSVFVGDVLYFIHAADFYEQVRLADGLEEEAFASLARIWEQTGQGVIGALPMGARSARESDPS